MREAIFILIVLAVILILTAIRYRKQIAGMIGFAKMMREAKRAAERSRELSTERPTENSLVNCAKCDIWVPQNKAVKFRDGFICSTVCQNAATIEKPAR